MNPFEASFENLTTNVKNSAKQAIKTTGNEVKLQVMGEKALEPVSNVGLLEQLGLKQVPVEEKKQVEEKQKVVLSQTRQNIERINQDIEQARKLRAKGVEEKKKEEMKHKQELEVKKNRQKQDPLWKRLLRGKTGSQEAPKNVSG